MPENILFVCVENAGRSQMAEAFFRKFAPNHFNVSSAGTTPSSQLNSIVIQVMKEVGIDMENQQPKLLSDLMIDDSFKTVITWGVWTKNHVLLCLLRMLSIGIFLILKKNHLMMS